ncbi:hypothetical protein [Micromonospora marina]|uniref:hypothetical protein n=1 Tax=Micromonospora marina TaxID=307120 RepID=UPI0034526ACB
MTTKPTPTSAGSASAVPGQRCMGCVEGITVKRHQCAGDKDLLPYGGTCQCPRAGCGPGGRRTTRTS